LEEEGEMEKRRDFYNLSKKVFLELKNFGLNCRKLEIIRG